MSKTPRTDAVRESASKLANVGMAIIPEGHPPCDPWELCEKLEIELGELQEETSLFRSTMAARDKLIEELMSSTSKSANLLREALTSAMISQANIRAAERINVKKTKG